MVIKIRMRKSLSLIYTLIRKNVLSCSLKKCMCENYYGNIEWKKVFEIYCLNKMIVSLIDSVKYV